tara:strand:+ start:104 stop:1105 length:1002 start_codon:yes stop_codon:yes gene_type:complete
MYIRRKGNKWQGYVRIINRPPISKCFKSKTDAKRWSVATENKIRREDGGIAKIKFPPFKDVALRYMNEITTYKIGYTPRVEKNIIISFLREVWAEYPINKITPSVIGKYRNDRRGKIKENTINRNLDVISTIFTTCKKEWGHPVDNPVLSIKRPRNPEPRDRRITDEEINLLLKGNRTSELLRTIIKVALETGMRQSEILNIHPEHLKGDTLFIPVAKTRPRTIPLTKTALEILKSYTLPFNIDRHLLGKHFRRLCKHYEIKDLHFHDLRKSALTSFMRDKNLSVPETMLIAGHKDPRMLLRVYNTLSVEDVSRKLRLMAEKVEHIYNGKKIN